jgi:Tol biopolymer transport system component
MPPGKPTKIYSVAADGGVREQLTTGESTDFAPSWWADGNSLVFGHSPYLAKDTSALAIEVLDLKTRQVSVLPGSKGLWHPACAPAGQYISALAADSQAIMLFNTATRKWTELARTAVNSPAWSRHKLERVGDLAAFRRAESGGWTLPWMGLAPDDSPLVVRDIGTQEIYALDWEAP